MRCAGWLADRAEGAGTIGPDGAAAFARRLRRGIWPPCARRSTRAISIRPTSPTVLPVRIAAIRSGFIASAARWRRARAMAG